MREPAQRLDGRSIRRRQTHLLLLLMVKSMMAIFVMLEIEFLQPAQQLLPQLKDEQQQHQYHFGMGEVQGWPKEVEVDANADHPQS